MFWLENEAKILKRFLKLSDLEKYLGIADLAISFKSVSVSREK